MSNGTPRSHNGGGRQNKGKASREAPSTLTSPYFLPKVIADIVDSHIHQCKNPALILDKYVRREVIEDKTKTGGWLKQFCAKKDGLPSAIDSDIVKGAYERWMTMLRAMDVTPFTAELEWRIIVGLGGESVLETDITLHHLYGIPIIPGSALKGMTRAYAAGEKSEGYAVPPEKPEAERKPSLEEDTDHPDIKRIFGEQDQAGTVIFFDALPIDGKFSFDVDLMNPHYPKYYDSLQRGQIEPPTNDQSPRLINFLTIKDASFAFAVAPRDPKDKDDARCAQELLAKALQIYGIGAKTSAGYGYFKESQELITTSSKAQTIASQIHGDASAHPIIIDPEIRKAESHKREIESLKQEHIAGQIHSFYQRWQQLTSQRARDLLALAIIEKVRQAGREKATAEKAWYKDLLMSLEASKD